MSEIKKNYEAMFIVNANLGEEKISATVEKFKALISANGELTKVEEIGKKRLAYICSEPRYQSRCYGL